MKIFTPGISLTKMFLNLHNRFLKHLPEDPEEYKIKKARHL